MARRLPNLPKGNEHLSSWSTFHVLSISIESISSYSFVPHRDSGTLVTIASIASIASQCQPSGDRSLPLISAFSSTHTPTRLHVIRAVEMANPNPSPALVSYPGSTPPQQGWGDPYWLWQPKSNYIYNPGDLVVPAPVVALPLGVIHQDKSGLHLVAVVDFISKREIQQGLFPEEQAQESWLANQPVRYFYRGVVRAGISP